MSAKAQEPSVTSSAESGPIYFWREFEEPYGFLSQWYDCSFEGPAHFEGDAAEGTEVYSSAEMWMMVQKARLFGDEVGSPALSRSTCDKGVSEFMVVLSIACSRTGISGFGADADVVL